MKPTVTPPLLILLFRVLKHTKPYHKRPTEDLQKMELLDTLHKILR